MIPRTNSCKIKQGQILVNKGDGMTCSHFILDKHPLTSGFSLLCELLQSSFSPVSGVRPQQSQRKSPTDSPWHLEGTNWYQHLAQIATIPTVRTPSPSCLHESKMLNYMQIQFKFFYLFRDDIYHLCVFFQSFSLGPHGDSRMMQGMLGDAFTLLLL